MSLINKLAQNLTEELDLDVLPRLAAVLHENPVKWVYCRRNVLKCFCLCELILNKLVWLFGHLETCKVQSGNCMLYVLIFFNTFAVETWKTLIVNHVFYRESSCHGEGERDPDGQWSQGWCCCFSSQNKLYKEPQLLSARTSNAIKLNTGNIFFSNSLC